LVSAVLAYLPRGNTLSDEAWKKRHLLLQWLLLLHVPGLFLFGLSRGYQVVDVAETVAVPFACLILGRLMRTRRLASFFVTAGLVYCSAALVGLSGGSIEAHFHFFIMIGFIALYQDWVPFLWNIVFTVLSHGFGSAFRSDLIFNHHAGIAHPWTWSVLHGVAVLAACVGVVLFWKQTEDEQRKTMRLRGELAASEINRRRFTADLLVNLARRNQNLLYRQLDLLNQLEENERDPDALSDLFQLDHLATRIRRNAESLLVLSGEEPARKWGRPVLLADVVRAAIAETEDLDRVDFAIDESLAVSGRAVADLTHLLAELIENAVHFSPPGMGVMLRTRPYLPSVGAQVLTIEDWGVGMRPEEIAEANRLLATPRDVDLSVSQRLGLHVVARLAQRYSIGVSLTSTPGGGVTAVVILPSGLFDLADIDADLVSPRRMAATPMPLAAPVGAPGRAMTIAPPEVARWLPPAPVSLPPVARAPSAPGVPPVPGVPAVPPVAVASRTAYLDGDLNGELAETSDGWHSWWTPRQRTNGHLSNDDDGWPTDSAPTAGSATTTPPPAPPLPPPLASPPPPPASPPPPLAPPPGGSAMPAAGTGRPAAGQTSRPAAGPAGSPPLAQPPLPTGRSGHAGDGPASQAPSGPQPGRPGGADRPVGPPGPPAPPGGTELPGNRAAPERSGSGGPSGAGAGADDGPRLTQRVPQANLVEGLRRGPGQSEQPQPLRDPEQAREALSRFQASQRAARALLEGGSTGESGNPNGSGGSDDRRS